MKSDSPGYLTVAFHRLRLIPTVDARTLADQLLADDLPVSARNQFRAARMRYARNYDEFLLYARRTPVDQEAQGDVIDSDSAEIFDRAVPLTLLRQAAASPQLPDATREHLKTVISTRALVLSPNPGFADVFQLLKTPGASPFVRPGYGRYTTDLTKSDLFRDNWWCPAAPSKQPPSADFLPAAGRAQAASEWQKLAALPAGATWLGAQTLAFAQAHPQDPRVPEALHLVVNAGHYSCSDAQTADNSRRAFELLHRRYPVSEWAEKTPYWYK